MSMARAVFAAACPLYLSLPPMAAILLVAGGLTYTAGAIVFVLDRPHLWPGRFSAHDLWHLFVLGGSACHFVAIRVYLMPPLPPALATLPALSASQYSRGQVPFALAEDKGT